MEPHLSAICGRDKQVSLTVESNHQKLERTAIVHQTHALPGQTE